jgi:hypothetical protein
MTNSSRYKALYMEDDDSDDDVKTTTIIPSFEDLSLYRNDEETVLQAVYGQDFSKEPGGNWGVHIYNIKVKPPDLQDKEVGCSVM